MGQSDRNWREDWGQQTELKSCYHSHRGDVNLITPGKRRNIQIKKGHAVVTPIKWLLISVKNPDREIVKWLSCQLWDLNSQPSAVITRKGLNWNLWPLSNEAYSGLVWILELSLSEWLHIQNHRVLMKKGRSLNDAVVPAQIYETCSSAVFHFIFFFLNSSWQLRVIHILCVGQFPKCIYLCKWGLSKGAQWLSG